MSCRFARPARRCPRCYLAPGEEIVSTIEGIGTIRNRCVAAAWRDEGEISR